MPAMELHGAVSQGVKAGGTSVSAAEDGEVVRPNICLLYTSRCV